MVFSKEYFEKVDFERKKKKTADAQLQNVPSRLKIKDTVYGQLTNRSNLDMIFFWKRFTFNHVLSCSTRDLFKNLLLFACWYKCKQFNVQK